MTSLRYNHVELEIAAAERDLLVANLNGLLVEAGVIEPDQPLSVDTLVHLVQHVYVRVRDHRSLLHMVPGDRDPDRP